MSSSETCIYISFTKNNLVCRAVFWMKFKKITLISERKFKMSIFLCESLSIPFYNSMKSYLSIYRGDWEIIFKKCINNNNSEEYIPQNSHKKLISHFKNIHNCRRNAWNSANMLFCKFKYEQQRNYFYLIKQRFICSQNM